jgi:hypothetical protein
MPEANISFNKRAYPRVPAHIPVSFLVMKEHKEIKDIRELIEKTKTVQSIDASLGGMKFEGGQGLEKGDILTLRLAIPTKASPISAFAEVVWVRSDGIGVHFLTMKDEDLQSLDLYLQSFPPGA